MDNADRRNIHARGACRDAGVYGAATDRASPTWGRTGKNSCWSSANCAKSEAFGATLFRHSSLRPVIAAFSPFRYPSIAGRRGK